MSDTNYLDLPDEEIEKLTLTQLEEIDAKLEQQEQDFDKTSAEDEGTYTVTEDDTSDNVSTEQSEDDDTSNVEDSNEYSDSDENQDSDDAQQDVSTKDVTPATDKDAQVDYKQAVERILAPFTANGKTVKVDSVEDAIHLMQMGANYTKKMQELKPHLRVVKMLENNGLLDESRLNMLIEVAQGKPEAIRKLVADSKLDLYSMDSEQDSAYQPGDYRVNDKDIELDNTIQELAQTPSFSRTASIVQNSFDEQSKFQIAQNPGMLTVINQHVSSGFYDEVVAEIDKLKMFDRVPANMSYVDLYGRVAQHLIDTKAGTTQQNAPTQGQQAQQQQSSVRQAQRNSRRDAIAPTRQAASSGKAAFNPLEMSDEEFTAASSTLFKTF